MVAVLRNRRKLLFVAFLAGFLRAVMTRLRPRAWTVASAFTPQSRQTRAALSGLAAQLGVTIPGTDAAQTPQFFESVLRTRGILESVIQSTYHWHREQDSLSGTLLDFLDISPGTPDQRMARASTRVLGRLDTSFNPKTGVVRVAFTSISPEISEQVNRRFLELLDQFNRETRRTQASAERQFTERRKEEVRLELRQAEDKLLAFLQSNRGFSSSSELAFQQERLQREVALQQQVYATLAQAYEQARVEEVRDTPVITIVDPPRHPLQPDRRRLLMKTALGIFLGLTLGSIAILAKIIIEQSADEENRDLEELTRLRAEILGELRRPWRLLSPPKPR
jgi:uncharacterized protein involved in exopolysaccharide biosynthesis